MDKDRNIIRGKNEIKTEKTMRERGMSEARHGMVVKSNRREREREIRKTERESKREG